jgi:Eco57I restriction-modification methylase
VPRVRADVAPRARERLPAEIGLGDRAAEVLGCYADDVPGDFDASAEALYDEWVALSFALARGVLSDRLPAAWLADAARGSTIPPERWPQLLSLGRELPLASTELTFPLLERYPAGAPVVRLLLGWLAELALRARHGADGVVRELGGLHETFLGLCFERLSTCSRRLRRSRVWLSPADVLRWPATVRSKRLQRELGLSKHTVHAFGPNLARARTELEVEQSLSSLFDPREQARSAGRCVLRTGSGRRTSGSHYTPWRLCLELVERALAPLVTELPLPQSQSLLSLRVCDPAMGAGAFLIAATLYLADALLAAWRREGTAPPGSDAELLLAARRSIAQQVLRGVDKNATAVNLARWSLTLLLELDAPPPELERALRSGDALIGRLHSEALPEWVQQAPDAFDWSSSFEDVFAREEPGFDAVVGNPPWVAYVGRAAQPLAPALAAHYAATNPAFKRYRTLHGLFVYRSAALLRRRGRLGLVLPTSVADLAGYGATRDAHDSLCRVDSELPDWGDGAFDGVFQPCMALLSTRHGEPSATPLAPSSSGIWPLKNDELGPTERRLLERLAQLPRLPREAFGERGFQTTEDDQAHLRRAAAAHPPCTVALREGADIGEFRARDPQLFGDPVRLGTRLRPVADWHDVKLLIRQTARFPMAALSDGSAFRNSILAGFDSPGYPATLLLGLLNSNLFRWFHYMQHRDARQGMPQLKVSHLRALPALPPDSALSRAALEALARRIGEANGGIEQALRAELDTLVEQAFGLGATERQAVAAWAVQHPPPVSRRQPPAERDPRPADLPAHGL